MTREILALVAEPLLLLFIVAILAAGVLLGMNVEQLSFKFRRKAWRKKNYSRWDNKRRDAGVAGPGEASPADILPKRLDPPDQLRIVMESDFIVRPLLNKSETLVFKELDRIVIGCNPAWRVMAQVSLGEILRCEDTTAYSCINSKRVDFLLIDGDCWPRHAIEYQGGAHHQGSAAARDAVKKEALRRAGIGYHEVLAGRTTPTDLRRLVEKLVDKPAAPK